MNTVCQFARTLGREPVVITATIKAKIRASLQLLVETFGPAERKRLEKSSLLFWTFRHINGATGFSMFAEVPTNRVPKQIEVCLATPKKSASFCEWTTLRLNAVENADEPPIFIDSERFTITAQVN